MEYYEDVTDLANPLGTTVKCTLLATVPIRQQSRVPGIACPKAWCGSLLLSAKSEQDLEILFEP
jgi:hypothetical protein